MSDEELEIYSTKLANFIITSEISVGDWNASEGGDIKVDIKFYVSCFLMIHQIIQTVATESNSQSTCCD